MFDQEDAQGRTILQIFALCKLWHHEGECRGVLTSAFERMLHILPKEYVNTRDKAGRTVLHWAVAHGTSWMVEKLLESGKAESNVTFQTAYIGNIVAFHLILLYDHNLSYIYHHYLTNKLIKNPGLYFPALRMPFAMQQWNIPQLWAIRMGRNKFVEQIMKTKVICPHLCTSLTLTLICSTV